MIRFLGILLLCAFGAEAATIKYLNASAAGSGTGNDWANAYTTLSAAETGTPRDGLCYVADGTYTGSVTFNTANSSTLTIEFRKATASDHGSDTGWSSTMGDGQAEFNGSWTFTSDYWIMDGVRGGGWSTVTPDKTPANYGFKFTDGRSTAIMIGTGSSANRYRNLTFKHIASLATTADTEKIFVEGMPQIGDIDYLTVTHCLLDGWQNALMTRGSGGSSGPYVYEFLVFRHNICLRGFSSSSNHGEWINANERPIAGADLRFNWFEDSDGTQTATIVGNNSSLTDSDIEGNVFKDLDVANGVLAGTSVANFSNNRINNNTFINCAWLLGYIYPYNGTGNTAKNNYHYNMNVSAGSGVTRSYSHYASCTSVPGTGTDANRTTSSGDPFVNLAGDDLRLNADTTAGDGTFTDLLGNTGSTRGAFQFASDSTPPTVSSRTIGTSGTTLTLALSETCSIGAGGNGGLTLSASGGAVTATYSSGSGSSSIVYSLSRTIYQGETVTASYTQPGSGIEDTAGNDLATFSGSAVTNNSTQQQSSGTGTARTVTARVGTVRSP